MRTDAALLITAALASVAGGAQAQTKGPGTGSYAWTAPVTKDAGPPAERPLLHARDEPIEPRHGLFGAPGAAPDAAGPTRLGPRGERAQAPSYGEAAQDQGGGEAYATWKSGDAVRSWSSDDVRATRQQQAPDLEWASAAPSQPPQDAPPATQPQEPYGKKAQKERRKPAR